MPYINIKLASSPSADKKAELISDITKLVSVSLNAAPENVFVFIEEFSPENVGIAGETIKAKKEKSK